MKHLKIRESATS